MVKCRKHIGLVLLLVYAFFFASTNFFYHSHQLAGCKIVHSHPFNDPGHSHTANQVLLIDSADSAIYQEVADLLAPDAVPALLCVGITACQNDVVLPGSFFSFSLRAPPTSC